jgi:hypothetical protein
MKRLIKKVVLRGARFDLLFDLRPSTFDKF